eukprot:663512-Karenia_brevis.AAC.1
MIYKHVKDSSCLARLPELISRARDTDYLQVGVACPVNMVHDSSGRLSGYTMRQVPGRTLLSWQASFTDSFPLAAVIGRVAVGLRRMAQN